MEGNGIDRFIDALPPNYLTASTDAHAKSYSLKRFVAYSTLLALQGPSLKKFPQGHMYNTVMRIVHRVQAEYVLRKSVSYS